MPSISVPNSFFVSERNTIYNDWRAAFWRELLSNAIDAGSTRVMIQTKFHEGKLRVDVIDNGNGMSRDTLETVYMKLGASTKGGSDAIGGFGRARILTCFSQDSYRIRSSNFVAIGSGAEYEVKETDNHVRGCAISISMPEEEACAIYLKLEAVLRESSLRCAVMVKLDRDPPPHVYLREPDEGFPGELDEKGWGRFKSWSRTGRLFDALHDEQGPWADLFVNEGAKANKHRAILRVDGMAMYSEYLSVPAQVTINLAPQRAREILTASRDGIRGQFREALQSIYQKISSERITAFKTKPVEPVTTLLSTADTSFREGFKLDARPSLQADPAPSAGFQADLPAVSPPHRDNWCRASEDRHEVQINTSDNQIDARSPGLKYPLVIHLADPTPAQRQASTRYEGATWCQFGGEGRNAELLFAAWTAAIKHTLGKLAEMRPDLMMGQKDRWVPGFIFDRDMLACYRSDDLAHQFLVNPVDEDGAARFKLSDPTSLKQLISEAIHEVSHLAAHRHDETFASVMTRLVGAIRDREIEKDIRDALDEMRQWQNRRTEIQIQMFKDLTATSGSSPAM